MNNIVIGLVLSAASFGVLANNGTGDLFRMMAQSCRKVALLQQIRL
ncbi:Uncharacterised protein [Moellerella wisconsensis]|nr:Uncharacterised protein [Moellerella wisconsensis]